MLELIGPVLLSFAAFQATFPTHDIQSICLVKWCSSYTVSSLTLRLESISSFLQRYWSRFILLLVEFTLAILSVQNIVVCPKLFLILLSTKVKIFYQTWSNISDTLKYIFTKCFYYNSMRYIKFQKVIFSDTIFQTPRRLQNKSYFSANKINFFKNSNSRLSVRKISQLYDMKGIVIQILLLLF